MKTGYQVFEDLQNFYAHYGENDDEANDAVKKLAYSHNHTCWLNPTDFIYSKRTRKLCKKWYKNRTNKPPKDVDDDKLYDCDNCRNLITYYHCGEDILFAFGNRYLLEKENKI